MYADFAHNEVFKDVVPTLAEASEASDGIPGLVYVVLMDSPLP